MGLDNQRTGNFEAPTQRESGSRDYREKTERNRPRKSGGMPILAVLMVFLVVLQAIQCGLSIAITRQMDKQTQLEEEIRSLLEVQNGKLAAKSSQQAASSSAMYADPTEAELPPEPSDPEVVDPLAASNSGVIDAANERQARVETMMDELAEKIQAEISDYDNEWSIYVEDLRSGHSISVLKNVEPDDKMLAASLIKVFVMAAVYDQINRGILEEAPLYDTIFTMIADSSNPATNTLIYALGNGDDRVGYKVVTDYAKSIGCYATEYNRLLGVNSKYEQNKTSAQDCARILRLIYDGACVTPEYSNRMRNILLKQHSSFPHGVPEDVPQAHKTGGIPNEVSGDMSIVYAVNPYIVCIIDNNAVNEPVCDASCTAISKMIYETMSSI